MHSKIQEGDFKAIYRKDPFTVSFDLENLKSGLYLIEGEVSEAHWQKACEQIGVSPEGGKCFARVVLDKSMHQLKLSGKIDVEMNRLCSRSGEPFMMKESLDFEESAYLPAAKDVSEEDMFESSTLDVGDYITQQIILEMNQFPISPAHISAELGAFDVTDKLESEEAEKKNPFSVLKSLKSDA